MRNAKLLWAAFMALSITGELVLSAEEAVQQSKAPEFGQTLNDEDYISNIKFYLFTRSSNGSMEQLYIDGKNTLNQSTFDPAKKTLVVIHGYESSIEKESVQGIKNAALENFDVNVIAVEWDYYTRNPNYGWVASKVGEVGTYVGKFIEFLIKNGLKNTDVHLIGHSLGAHVSGFAGKQLRRHGHPAARITGLDPAFPGFYNINDAEGRLNSRDAEFVDCIHTCGGKWGFPVPICQADFFPNGGVDVQPGCSILDAGICSHGRSHQFFAESMNARHLFDAKSCKAIAIWIPYNCKYEGALMGYPASPKYKGTLTLTTNSAYPFAKRVIKA